MIIRLFPSCSRGKWELEQQQADGDLIVKIREVAQVSSDTGKGVSAMSQTIGPWLFQWYQFIGLGWFMAFVGGLALGMIWVFDRWIS